MAELRPAPACAVISGTDRDNDKVFHDIQKQIDVGLQLYSARRKSTDERFHDIFVTLDSLVTAVGEQHRTLSEGAPSFDFVHDDGERVEANGYRSLLYVLNCCLLKLRKHLAKSDKDRGRVWYIPGDGLANITAYTRALEGMELILQHAVMLMESSLSSQQLFNDDEVSVTLKRFLSSQYINRDVYYGQCLGFQFPPAMRRVLKPVAIGMASYEIWYRGTGRGPVRKLLQSLWRGSKYLNDPCQLGVKLDDLTQDCSVRYVKAYWSLLELDTVKAAVSIISPSVEVSSCLEIPTKNITIEGSKGIVELTPPCSSDNVKPITILLISHQRRVGQSPHSPPKCQRYVLDPSPGLVVHVHGGGFVAHSPWSHEMYLRKWARELDTPIVSIDYTLAPEGVFPRALEEIIFAYIWILQNSELLGSTVERVVFAGDSSGGNLVIAAAMKLVQLGLRLPDSIISCYPATILTSSVSPSRFLCLMDILLPIGVLISCQKAYCGCVPDDEELQTRKDARKRLWKAKGIIIPEPGSKPPVMESPLKQSRHSMPETTTTWKRLISRSRFKSAPLAHPSPPSSSSSSSSTSTASASGIHQKTTMKVGAREALEEMVEMDQEEQTDDVFVEDPAAPLLLGDREESHPTPNRRHPLNSFCFHRHEPDEADKLSQVEKEQLISEVLKSYESPDVSTDPLMSIALAPLDMLKGLPPIHIIGAMLDPLLDDTIVLAKRLQAARQPVTLNIFPDLPHGFLSLVSAGNEPQLTAAHHTCLGYLKQGLGLE